MIVTLAFKFYLKHSKRSMRGSSIIAMSLLTIIITQIMILAFTTQLSQITAIVEKEDNYLIIEPRDGFEVFDNQTFKQLTNFLEQNNKVEEHIIEYRQFANFYYDGELNEATIHFTNFSKIMDQDVINENFAYITQEFSGLIEIGNNFSLTIRDHNETIFLGGYLSSEKPSIDVGIYLSDKQFNISAYSEIYVYIKKKTYTQGIIEVINSNWKVSISTRTSEAEFINNSRDNITQLLRILTIMISFLIILGISNLIRTILFESEYDIRVLKSIGYSIFEIRTIYFLLTNIIAIVGILFCFIIGFGLPILLFSMISLITSNIFIPTRITLSIIINITLVGLLTTTISSIKPIWRLIR